MRRRTHRDGVAHGAQTKHATLTGGRGSDDGGFQDGVGTGSAGRSGGMGMRGHVEGVGRKTHTGHTHGGSAGDGGADGPRRRVGT